MLIIHQAKKENIKEIAKISLLCFHGFVNLNEAIKWTACNFQAFPRFQYFIIKYNHQIIGYILWYFKGGWRKKSVLELEQIAIDPSHQGQGFGTRLIKESLSRLVKNLKKEKRKLGVVLVTTSTEQKAKKIYEKTLGARTEAKIKKLFRGDEIILIRRFK